MVNICPFPHFLGTTRKRAPSCSSGSSCWGKAFLATTMSRKKEPPSFQMVSLSRIANVRLSSDVKHGLKAVSDGFSKGGMMKNSCLGFSMSWNDKHS